MSERRLGVLLAYESDVVSSAIAQYVIRSACDLSAYVGTELRCYEFTSDARDQTIELVTEQAPKDLTLSFRHVDELQSSIKEDLSLLISHDFPSLTDVLRRVRRRSPELPIHLSAVSPPFIDEFTPGPTPGSPRGTVLARFVSPALSVLYRRRVGLASGVIALSNFERHLLTTLYKVKQVVTSFPSIDPKFRPPSKLGEYTVIISPAKPLRSTLKEIAKLVSSLGSPVHIIGSGANSTARLFSDTITTVHGFLPRAEYRALVSRAQIAFLTESHGAFEMAPLELIQAGVPVASPKVPSLVELSNLSSAGGTIDEIYWDLGIVREPKYFHAWYEIASKARQRLSEFVSANFNGHDIAGSLHSELGLGVPNRRMES